MTNHTTYTIDVELTDEEANAVHVWYVNIPVSFEVEGFTDLHTRASAKMRRAFVEQHPPLKKPDPKPGDVAQHKGPGYRRTVKLVDDGWVYMSGNDHLDPHVCPVDYFHAEYDVIA